MRPASTNGVDTPHPATPREGVIWVVDDSPLEARATAASLAGVFHTETLPDGASLLERLALGEQPDLIVLDWYLPDLTGPEVCVGLREHWDQVALPVLMLTAQAATPAHIHEALSAGANDYLSKPHDATELLVRARTLVRTRRLHQSLVLSEERSRGLVAAMAEGVVFQGPDRAIEHANRSAELLLGFTLSEMVGRTPHDKIWELLREDGSELPDAEHPAARAFDTRRPVIDGIVNLRRPDGTRIWLQMNSQPLFALDGRSLIGVVSSLVDITERLLADREARARASYERQLIGVVSHDLRSPLQTIALSTQVLRRSPGLDDGIARSLDRIDRSTQRAIRMVRDLLDFTQARLGGGMRLTRARADLHQVVANAVQDLRLVHETATMVCEHSGAGDGDWDADRVEQLVGNLVSNAAVHGEPGAPIRISTRATEELVTLEVANPGRPVPPEILGKMFEPMKRGGDESAAAPGSIGLGLYIVKQIAEAHAGRAQVRSSEEEGTVVTVTLPRPGRERSLPAAQAQGSGA